MEQAKDDPKGLQMLEQAAEIGGPRSLYSALLADHVWANSDRQRALSLMKAASKGSLVPEVPFITARMLRQSRQDPIEALAYVDQAINIVPDVRRFVGLKSHLLLDLNRTEEAEKTIDSIASRFIEGGDLETLRKRLAECTAM